MRGSETKEGHPVRGLLRVAGVAALVYFGWKLFESKREELMGLTESEARAKLRDKLLPRLGEDTTDQIVDQIVPKLREAGILQPDPA